MSRVRVIFILWTVDFGISGLALAAFLIQGGFGAGHLPLDPLIGTLALPWAFVPWPHRFLHRDVVWLVLLPFVLNSAVVAAIHAIMLAQRWRRRRAEARGSVPPKPHAAA